MTRYSEQPGNMRRRIEAQQARTSEELILVERTGSGRKLARSDSGTVALAMSGMAFYWLPMLMGAKRSRRKHRKPAAAAPNPQDGA